MGRRDRQGLDLAPLDDHPASKTMTNYRINHHPPRSDREYMRGRGWVLRGGLWVARKKPLTRGRK